MDERGIKDEEAEMELEPDVTLLAAGGRQLKTFSQVLCLASKPLRGEIHKRTAAKATSRASGLQLSMADDSAEGWLHVLDLISPHLGIEKLNLVGPSNVVMGLVQGLFFLQISMWRPDRQPRLLAHNL